MNRAAVLFGYHEVGARGLEALLAQGMEVRLVVTHEDDPGEEIWFSSVAELARRNGIPVITPDDPNTPEVIEQVRQAQPDWLFSFYYRRMLGSELLSLPRQGALNLHGSLLPKYRGRVPVNWAVLNGEQETGATLHRMVEKPDAGAILDQQAVPILPNDTAVQVFRKVVCAAEMVLARTLPKLLDGSWRETPQDLSAGSYFRGRRPEDGRIDWSQGAWQVHNLVRAVAPPYPPAFFDHEGHRIHLLGSYWRDEPAAGRGPRLYREEGRLYADCVDGKRFEITAMDLDGRPLDEAGFEEVFGNELLIGP